MVARANRNQAIQHPWLEADMERVARAYLLPHVPGGRCQNPTATGTLEACRGNENNGKGTRVNDSQEQDAYAC